MVRCGNAEVMSSWLKWDSSVKATRLATKPWDCHRPIALRAHTFGLMVSSLSCAQCRDKIDMLFKLAASEWAEMTFMSSANIKTSSKRSPGKSFMCSRKDSRIELCGALPGEEMLLFDFTMKVMQSTGLECMSYGRSSRRRCLQLTGSKTFTKSSKTRFTASPWSLSWITSMDWG